MLMLIPGSKIHRHSWPNESSYHCPDLQQKTNVPKDRRQEEPLRLCCHDPKGQARLEVARSDVAAAEVVMHDDATDEVDLVR
jgi:hypothetical protein